MKESPKLFQSPLFLSASAITLTGLIAFLGFREVANNVNSTNQVPRNEIGKPIKKPFQNGIVTKLELSGKQLDSIKFKGTNTNSPYYIREAIANIVYKYLGPKAKLYISKTGSYSYYVDGDQLIKPAIVSAINNEIKIITKENSPNVNKVKLLDDPTTWKASKDRLEIPTLKLQLNGIDPKLVKEFIQKTLEPVFPNAVLVPTITNDKLSVILINKANSSVSSLNTTQLSNLDLKIVKFVNTQKTPKIKSQNLKVINTR